MSTMTKSACAIASFHVFGGVWPKSTMGDDNAPCAQRRKASLISPAGDWKQIFIDNDTRLFVGAYRNDSLIYRSRKRAKSGRLETGLLQHLFVFSERIGVAFWRRGEHDQAEAGGRRRRNAIRVWDELNNRDMSARSKRRMDFFQKFHAIV